MAQLSTESSGAFGLKMLSKSEQVRNYGLGKPKKPVQHAK